ncbi:MAG: LptE family protein [Sphingobacteriaceae bacterium]|nr:MAG: hypothetical protein E6Q66_05465 [Pedobacter sp.]
MIKFISKKIGVLFVVSLLSTIQSCGIYSFSGASIPETMKTVSIRNFENTAPLVIPYLSQQLTKALEDRVRNNSRLSVIRSDADAIFEGRITGYNVSATAVQGNNQSTTSRLTITVHVKYQNNLKPELSFEQDFTQFKDFSIVGKPLEAQQQDLITDINQRLTEDIFNRAFANW